MVEGDFGISQDIMRWCEKSEAQHLAQQNAERIASAISQQTLMEYNNERMLENAIQQSRPWQMPWIPPTPTLGFSCEPFNWKADRRRLRDEMLDKEESKIKKLMWLVAIVGLVVVPIALWLLAIKGVI